MLLFLLPTNISAISAAELIPGGQVVGLELRDGTVTVAAVDEDLGKPCLEAGIRAGDRIGRIDETQIRCTADVDKALRQSQGSVTVELHREGKSFSVRVEPTITDQGPRLGLYLRQGVTGIGTVTWYDPEDQTFGTLGHGVSTARGKLVEMTSGYAYPAGVLGVRKAKIGEPGQLIGALETPEPIGTLTANREQGVFGKGNTPWTGESIQTAASSEIHTGSATILSTVAGEEPREYSVEILKIYPRSQRTGRNLLLKIQDPTLMERTGGIVQGMSGSPILQDGKLIGAVTNVLVNDATVGYGIYIGNMLEAAA